MMGNERPCDLCVLLDYAILACTFLKVEFFIRPVYSLKHNSFVTERKRHWEVREALKAINHKLAFVTSDNPAAAGRFLEEHFSAKRHDTTTIRINIDDLSEVETDSQIDIIDRVVGSSPSSSSDESSPETDFLPEPGEETLPSKYGRKRARFERNNYVSWYKIVFYLIF